MSCFALTGARVLTPAGWLEDHAVIIEHGLVARICPIEEVPPSVDCQALAGGTLIPGFVDVQVNGGGGVLFNEQPTVEGIAKIAAAHRRFGTTAMLPTLISDDLGVVRLAIEAVAAAIDQGVPGVVGIHLEGPFLNSRKSGIHQSSKFKTLDTDAVDLLSSLCNGVTLVTLAPEVADAGIITELVGRGVIVAAGHTMATYDCLSTAVEEGLTGVTHLFNAMTPLEGRAPGVVGAALDLNLFCGVIVDGQHVHPAALRIALATLGHDRLMLVTDAMPTVGSSAKSFNLAGRAIVADGGACRAEDGTLAGSDLDMALAVRNAISLMGIDLAQASKISSATPAQFLGLERSIGSISVDQRADLIHLNEQLQVNEVWSAGSTA